MLKLVMGSTIDKRMVYRAMSTLDTDGDRSLSLDELLLFVYKVWRAQLDELAELLNSLSGSESDNRAVRLLRERDDVKAAIKRNFTRAWRDRVEREGHTVSGPFSSLLTHLGLGGSRQHQQQHDTLHSHITDYSDGQRDTSHSQHDDVSRLHTSHSLSHNPSKARAQSMPGMRPLSATSTGNNGLLRFKIMVAGGTGSGDGGRLGRHSVTSQSHREGMALGLPAVKNLMDASGVSEHFTAYSLGRQR